MNEPRLTPSGAAMCVAVMGAGAVGCYYGFLLARGGHDVTLIGRPALVEAVTAGGLVLEMAHGRETVRVRAGVDASGVSGADLVLICVKSGDTEAAGRMIAPHLSAHATILSLQNGVDNAGRLQAVIGRPVVPAVVYVATATIGPGCVRHNGRGDLIVGPSEASAAIAAVFTAAGIPTTVSEHAVDALWGKLILNCAWNALSALTQRPYGGLIGGEGVVAAMSDVVAECVAVARASGVAVSDDVMAGVLAIGVTMAEQRSSTAQDLARGRRSEIDHLNGFVMRQGAALGIPTPANRMLHTLVKLAEDGLRPGGPPPRPPAATVRSAPGTGGRRARAPVRLSPPSPGAPCGSPRPSSPRPIAQPPSVPPPPCRPSRRLSWPPDAPSSCPVPILRDACRRRHLC